MGITRSNPHQFDDLAERAAEAIRKEMEAAFAYLGEQCVARIRDRSAEESWIDHTGNLRSSIGYAVYGYGRKLVEATFEADLGGDEGSARGKRYVPSLAHQYATTIALVVVAGMSYADYVESINNKDVLASTELWARSVVKGYIQQALNKAMKSITK